MSVSIKDVEYIAGLAKLSFTAQEKKKFVHQFNQILSFVEKLNELDTKDVAPTYNPLNLTNVMREDECSPGLSQDDALKNAPRQKHGYFSVPKVIG